MPNFVPFILILFVIAAVLRIDFFFTIAYLFFAAHLLSRLWVRRSVGRLSARRNFARHAFPGDLVTVALTLHNRDWLPVAWLEVHESLPVALCSPPHYRQVVTLGAGEQQTLQYELNCRQRGYYPVGPLTMQTGDLFGIVPSRQTQYGPEPIIVYPQVIPLQKLGLPTRTPQVVLPANSSLFEDPARVMGVRDYQRGDSPRRIHWTATARAGRLLVKQYQPAIARETLVCLDLDWEGYGQRQRYAATELAIVVAASIANHVITREGLPAGLATEAWDPLADDRMRFVLPPRSEQTHLMSILEVLARVQITSEGSFVDLLRRESVNLPWGATLSIITGRESVDLLDTLAYLRRSGLKLALILVQPPHTPDNLKGRASVLGVPIHRIWRNEDMEMLR